jgi:hypothetical protein
VHIHSGPRGLNQPERTSRFSLDFNNVMVLWIAKSNSWGVRASGQLDGDIGHLEIGREGAFFIGKAGEREAVEPVDLYSLIQQIGQPQPLWRNQANLKQALYERLDPSLERIGGLEIKVHEDEGQVFGLRLMGSAKDRPIRIDWFEFPGQLECDAYSSDPRVILSYKDPELGPIRHELTRNQQGALRKQIPALLQGLDEPSAKRSSLEKLLRALWNE